MVLATRCRSLYRFFFSSPLTRPPPSALFPYTTLFRSLPDGRPQARHVEGHVGDANDLVDRVGAVDAAEQRPGAGDQLLDRKSTRLNSSHVRISYAVFCLKKKTTHCATGARRQTRRGSH